MNDCNDDLNATRDLLKMGKSLKFMNQRSLRFELSPDYNYRSLNLLENGDKSFNNAPLLAIASLSYRTTFDNDKYKDDVYKQDVLRAKLTPQQLLERSREYDPKIDAYQIERSLETMLNNHILEKVTRIHC